MTPFNRILVCTDFSDTGNRAVSNAFGMAAPGTHIVLAHCVEPPPVPNPMYAHVTPDPAWAPDVMQRVQKTVRSTLESLVPKDLNETIEVEFESPLGNATSEIPRLAQKHQADLIVIGTHGRTGLRRLLLGSVAERVVRTAECPVLVIH